MAQKKRQRLSSAELDAKVSEYIRGYYKVCGYVPAVSEIQKQMGKTQPVISRSIKRLKAQGTTIRPARSQRGYDITPEGPPEDIMSELKKLHALQIETALRLAAIEQALSLPPPNSQPRPHEQMALH